LHNNTLIVSFWFCLEIERGVWMSKLLELVLKDRQMLFEIQRDLVASTVNEISELVKEKIDDTESYDELVFDMKYVNNMDSIAFTFVLDICRRAEVRCKLFRIVNLNPQIYKLFQRLGILQNMGIPIELRE